MQVNLFDLATKQAQWLSVRQSAIAGNIANVNTPGYHALEVEPFAKVLDGNRVAMQATQPNHLVGGAGAEAVAVRSREEQGAAVLPSGNSVVLENELIDAGDVRRSFELNTAIVKVFNRMTMLASKG
ncbi:flagellar basal body rod protein FlgB [Mesorhizobium sp. BAC0120]|uniref:flagellar basal body rod protein FlgB n=1 Tax=Mesorhizobium sp. BAC0120 TaxID=3090670 RepID=UPI00298BE554|nr:flagellar basal body rod protein FlgB [Mesorhizobium sp. BAC0120]MDW6024446.1 flagellar basal body rod protein FlgB [Mesorhizobium sp. BAC0120]